jgi:hypothetical protein
MSSPFDQLEVALTAGHRWLAPYARSLRRVLNARCSASVAEALNAASSERDITFVEQTVLPRDEAYEAFVFRSGCVPTRDNMHDLLNGIAWLNFPLTKRRLNCLQAAQIERHGVIGARGAVRDALTLFDENAALLDAPPELVDALRARDWQRLFVAQRQLWSAARLVLFGHALMEKLLEPRKAITAHVWIVDSLEDAQIAATLDEERLSRKPFLPLPVLGVPGWCAENADPTFYDDTQVFRTGRQSPFL